MQFSNRTNERTNDCIFNFRVISSVISRFMTIVQFFGIYYTAVSVAVVATEHFFLDERAPTILLWFHVFFGTPMYVESQNAPHSNFTCIQRKGAKIRLSSTLHVIHAHSLWFFCGFKYYVLNSVKRMRYFIWPFQTKSDVKCELWTYDK